MPARPKLDYLLKRQQRNEAFVPFANERDRLNRLLPILQKSRSDGCMQQSPKVPPSDYYISYKSNRLEANQRMEKQLKKCTHPSILLDFVGSIKAVKAVERDSKEALHTVVVPATHGPGTASVASLASLE